MAEEDLLPCSTCKGHKPSSEFYRNRSQKSGYNATCKPCHKIYYNAWRKGEIKVEHPHVAGSPAFKKLYRSLRRYKTTPAWYRKTLEAQGGCAICGVADNNGRPFYVDHRHSCCATTPTCGKCNRGLLCHSCNCALAGFDRCVGFGTKAEEYLARHGR
jgi:hypothetical protein